MLIAQVKLRIGDLFLRDNNGPCLEGTYSIEVPIRASKNEIGAMRLPLEQDIQTYLAEGGTLSGIGESPKVPGAQRMITCRITPDPERENRGALVLEIDTGHRVMCFETAYEVIGGTGAIQLAYRSETVADTPTVSRPAGAES